MSLTPSQIQKLKANYDKLSPQNKLKIDSALEVIERERCQSSLMEFVRSFWHIVEPSNPMLEGEVLEQICAHLEAVTRFYETNGESGCQDLLINVPPGCSKSLITSVFWPAWEWGPRNRPNLRYVCFSYSENLTLRDNARFATIIKSSKYQRMWKVKITKDTEGKISNSAMGWKIATSVGGMGTGERGDRIVIDDPHNVKSGDSEKIMESTLQWWREVIPTRLNNPSISSKVIIMQRVKENDVSGDVIERSPEVVHLMLPMEYDPTRPCETPFGGEWRTEAGELLWEERFSQETVDKYKNVMGPYAYASQMQQEPVPRGGGIIKRQWWLNWDNEYASILGLCSPSAQLLIYPPFEFTIAVVDGAYTENTKNDPSAMVVMGIWRDENDFPKVMLCYAWQKYLTIHGPPILSTDTKEQREAKRGLVENVHKTCMEFRVDKLLIEGKATGLSLHQELGRLFNGAPYSVDVVNPKGDKVSRAHAVVPIFTNNQVYAPEKSWADMVINQVEQFPNGKHDDLVDCVTYALTWLRNNGLLNRPSEQKAIEDEMFAPRGQVDDRIYPV